jgi:hypothetical protein
LPSAPLFALQIAVRNPATTPAKIRKALKMSSKCANQSTESATR